MVGHRQNVGHGLVSESAAKELEEGLIQEVRTVEETHLSEEWDLTELSLRIPLWLDGEDRDQLLGSLSRHLSDDKVVLALLRTAVNYARYNNHVEKRIYWDELLGTFGEGLREGVERIDRSESFQGLLEDDRDTIELALRYASGERPKAWHER